MPLDNRNTELYKYLEGRRSTLEEERVSFERHWKDLSQYIQPRRGRFFVQERNKGYKRHNDIINSVGTQSLRTASSGMFAGIMSPSRPWFKLVLDDVDMMDRVEISTWFSDVERIFRLVFNQSNLYTMSPVMISELLLFATGCILHVDDDKDILRFYTQTVGSYYLSQNDRYEVDTLMREFEMTVNQMVSSFGYNNVSGSVRSLYDRGTYDKWFPVFHMIEPRVERSEDNPFNTNSAFRSIYYQAEDNEKRILRESGFDEFPAYCPRWGLTGEDVYGTDCPGMVVLGDVKQVQLQEKRKQQAIDKSVNPPLKGPASLRNQEVNGLPGGLTLYDNNGATSGDGLSPIFEIEPPVQHLIADIEKTEKRIQDGFFLDLFRAFTNLGGSQYKNKLELIERNAERLLEVGPVLQQFQKEFLDKLITRTFKQIVNRGLLPQPPPILQGQNFNIRYISSLAQAQEAVAAEPIERVANFAAGLASVNPDALDKFDSDQAIDEYNRAILGPARLVRDDEQVAEIREARQQQQQMQQAMEMVAQGAGAAKDGADAVNQLTGENNA